MPSSVGHAAVAAILGPILGQRPLPRAALTTAIVCAVIPDVDAIGRPFGYGDVALLGGHRGITHSLTFAIALAAVTSAALRRSSVSEVSRLRLFVYVFAVTMLHGVLDAFTTYGAGIAFFAPFSMLRWKSAWQPFSGILPEVIVLWIPALVMLRWQKVSANTGAHQRR